MTHPFYDKDLSKDLTGMVTDPRVIYREKGYNNDPGLITMFTLTSDFIVKDVEFGLTNEQLDLKYIFPILQQFASVCNNYIYLVTVAPGRTEQSCNGDAVSYKQACLRAASSRSCSALSMIPDLLAPR